MKKLTNLFFAMILVAMAVYLLAFTPTDKALNEYNRKATSIKWIVYDTLVRHLDKLNTDRLLIEVYPTKQSGSLKKNDFNVEVRYFDANHSSLTSSIQPTESGALKKEAKNYVAWLKNKKTPQSQIPYGYHLTIDRHQLKGNKNLSLYMFPNSLSVKYSIDSCKFPPGCSFNSEKDSDGDSETTTLLLDSACKFPPGCLNIPLSTLFMNDIIKTQYKSKGTQAKK